MNTPALQKTDTMTKIVGKGDQELWSKVSVKDIPEIWVVTKRDKNEIGHDVYGMLKKKSTFKFPWEPCESSVAISFDMQLWLKVALVARRNCISIRLSTCDQRSLSPMPFTQKRSVIAFVHVFSDPWSLSSMPSSATNMRSVIAIVNAVSTVVA